MLVPAQCSQNAPNGTLVKDTTHIESSADVDEVAIPLPPPLTHSYSPNSVRDVDGVPTRPLLRAPFKATFRYDVGGRGEHVAILRTHGTHVYWGTSHQPPPHMDAVQVDPSTAPPEVLRAVTELGATAFGTCAMWVLRRGRLANAVGIEAMPPDTRLRCAVGFIPHRVPKPDFTGPPAMKLARRVLRLHKVLKANGGHALGVRSWLDKHGSVKYKFSLKKLVGFLTCTPNQLAALIADSPTTAACFSGKVSYAARGQCNQPPDGLIHLTQPVPAGKWLAGRFIDTGIGLVARNESAYYKIENTNNVSKLVPVYPHDFVPSEWSQPQVAFADFIE